ncbi:MAG TPA: HAD-IA family hydrolase [Anaerolineales bacterium]|nr:HAD-IA family hydrolase [Anaerolineales bacterium]
MRTQNHAPRLVLAERIGVDYREMGRLIFDSEESRRAQLGEIPARSFWAAMGYSLRYDEFMGEFFRGDIIDQELVQSIRRLRARYKTGLLCNAFSDLRYWISEWKIDDAFDHMPISAEVNLMKPDLAIYSLAAKHLGITPQEAIFIDDVAANIQGAQQVGMHGRPIHFPRTNARRLASAAGC